MERSPSPNNPIPGSAVRSTQSAARHTTLTRKDDSSRGSCLRLRAQSAGRESKLSLLAALPPTQHDGHGIQTVFPFDRESGYHKSETQHTNILPDLPCLLGAAHSRPSAVHVKPFSTPVFKLTSLLNICYCHQDLHCSSAPAALTRKPPQQATRPPTHARSLFALS